MFKNCVKRFWCSLIRKFLLPAAVLENLILVFYRVPPTQQDNFFHMDYLTVVILSEWKRHYEIVISVDCWTCDLIYAKHSRRKIFWIWECRLQRK